MLSRLSPADSAAGRSAGERPGWSRVVADGPHLPSLHTGRPSQHTGQHLLGWGVIGHGPHLPSLHTGRPSQHTGHDLLGFHWLLNMGHILLYCCALKWFIMSPPLWGRHIVFALSVCPSIRLSVCHTSFPLNNSSTL